MSKSIDDFDRMKATQQRMTDPAIADNMEVRLEILSRIKSGSITLQQGQKELRRIQNAARARGESTAYRP